MKINFYPRGGVKQRRRFSVKWREMDVPLSLAAITGFAVSPSAILLTGNHSASSLSEVFVNTYNVAKRD